MPRKVKRLVEVLVSLGALTEEGAQAILSQAPENGSTSNPDVAMLLRNAGAVEESLLSRVLEIVSDLGSDDCKRHTNAQMDLVRLSHELLESRYEAHRTEVERINRSSQGIGRAYAALKIRK